MEKKLTGSNNIIDQKDLKRSLDTIAKNWMWFVLFLALGIAGSIAYLYKATKYYGATTAILVKPPKDPFKDALSESLPSSPKKEDVINEMKILKSSKMIDEAITKLKIDVSYYIEGRIKTGEVYRGTPFTVEGKVSDPELYEVPFTVNILSPERFKVSVNTETYKFSREARFGDPVVTDRFSFIVNNDSNVIKKNKTISDIAYVFKIHNRQMLIR